MQSLSDRAVEHWDEVAPVTRDIAQDLWDHPELPLAEIYSSKVLRDWLESAGFSVRDSASGMDTAFIAEYGSGGPAVGILLEYDALPAMSNVAEPRRQPTDHPNTPGHACGHHLIGSVNTGAAIAAARALDEAGVPGRIIVYGCPAEEILYGKVAMLEAGDFDGADVVLAQHPSRDHAAVSRPSMSIVNGELRFNGDVFFTSGGPKMTRNAQDACDLTIAMVEKLRSHIFPDVSIEYTRRAPVTALPSNSPEEMRCWWYVRHADLARAEQCFAWIADLALTAASTNNVDVAHIVVSATRGYLPNDALARVLYDELAVVNLPRWDDRDLKLMKSFTEAVQLDTFRIEQNISLITEGIDRSSQDDGELSHKIPLGRYTWAVPYGVPLHSWISTAYLGTELAWRSAEPIGAALARTIVRLTQHTGEIDASVQELHERTGGFKLVARGAWKELPGQAEAYWRGDWNWT